MPRTLEQWIDAEHRKMQKVHSNIDRAATAELVLNVRELQKTMPRGKWPRRGSQKARGYKVLHQSIKIDHKNLSTFTDHPGAETLEHGATMRPKRKRWLTLPLKGSWTPGKAGFMAIRTKSGNLAIVHQKRPQSGIVGLFLKQAVIPKTRWITRGNAATVAGSDERIADKVIDTRGN